MKRNIVEYGERNQWGDPFFSKILDCEELKEKFDIPFGDVVIEQIFVLGYASSSGVAKSKMDNFYNYGPELMGKDGVIDLYKVSQIMKKKHIERAEVLSSFLCEP